MRNKSLVFVLSFFVFGVSAFAAGPWAVISYAEGKTFNLIRNGKTAVHSVDSSDVFGMEIRQGDIIHTSAATFLEITINSVSATVQVAENTSFKCDADSGGAKVSGELYYGRVRAKVAKLAGSSSFKISTPTLVAGVRGTDFGCDVIAVRGAAQGATQGAGAGSSAAQSAATPVLNRVFCFEGSVAVTKTEAALPVSKSAGGAAAGTAAAGATALKAPETVVIGKNEMVENVVADSAAPLSAEPLKKAALPEDVHQFWESLALPAAATVLPADETGLRTYGHSWPAGRDEKASIRNLKVPAIAAAALIVFGSAACIGSAAYASNVDLDGVFVMPAHSAGVVMISSGTILALLSTFFQ
jgi:hypothetical protein